TQLLHDIKRVDAYRARGAENGDSSFCGRHEVPLRTAAGLQANATAHKGCSLLLPQALDLGHVVVSIGTREHDGRRCDPASPVVQPVARNMPEDIQTSCV